MYEAQVVEVAIGSEGQGGRAVPSSPSPTRSGTGRQETRSGTLLPPRSLALPPPPCMYRESVTSTPAHERPLRRGGAARAPALPPPPLPLSSRQHAQCRADSSPALRSSAVQQQPELPPTLPCMETASVASLLLVTRGHVSNCNVVS